MPPPRDDPAAGPSRRSLLRLLGATGLAGAGLGLAGCSAADREALLAVDPSRLRVDEGAVARAEPPGPSERELRRRAVRAGSVAALAAYAGVATAPPALVGRTGGAADVPAVRDVHRVHADVLAGSSTPPSSPPASGGPLLPGVRPEAGGPSLAPAGRPLAVLRTGATAALRACAQERAAAEPDVPLAVLHALVAAARTAQTTALEGDGVTTLVWPGAQPGTGVAAAPIVAAPIVAALRTLLAQEHRASWSYAVVQAWSTDREPDAGAARQDHTHRAEQLDDLLTTLGAAPVGAAATYPTDDDGTPVDGPVRASALALRLEDRVATASAAVLVAAVTAPGGDAGSEQERWAAWVRGAVRALAEAERARWSWGGRPVPWPGS